MKRLTYLSLLFAGCYSLMACHAKLTPDSSASPNPPQGKAFTHLVQGPDLNGTWASGCEPDRWSNDYVIFTLTVNDPDISRKEVKYADPNCRTQTSELDRVGKFRYKAAYASGIYEVEYRFNIANGYYESGDNISLVQNRLWISDRSIGDGVIPDIPLDKVTP